MANNRMYLVHKETGEKVSFLKYYPSTGWYVNPAEDFKILKNLADFLAKYDEDSASSMYGDFFRLEYEETTDGA